MSDYWVHDLSPFIFEFSPGIGLRWYGMAYLLGLFLGYLLARRWVNQGRAPLHQVEIQDFVLFCGIGMIVGGRIGYCLLYNFSETIQNPLYLFQVWDGGMASHGGIIGLVAGCWWFAYKRKRDFLVLGDLLAATGTLGIAAGRLANFVNGELWGRPTQVPWAVIFPQSVPAPEGMSAADTLAYQIAHAVPRHPSQLYAMVLEGLLVFAILLPLHARHRRPGLTGAGFLLLYAFGRFVGEFFREPDVGQPVFFGWLTKGQAYTLPMFAIGAALLIFTLRRPPQPERYPLPATEEKPPKQEKKTD